MSIPLIPLMVITLIAVFVAMIIGILWGSKDNIYVVQADGHSAKISVYAICLIDKNMHRILIKMTKNGPIVTTVHDFIPVEGRKEVWANTSKLTFTYENNEVIVHWGEDLEIWHD